MSVGSGKANAMLFLRIDEKRPIGRLAAWSLESKFPPTLEYEPFLLHNLIETYAIVDIHGRSVIATEGDDWKLHKKIVLPF
ncbi:hypothetical protein PROFUN_12118 [Planoprotostelium fungivorum]|uniref:Uncharacterized protein n=1 Tax=Planoprotostelium fungivorum TaxID=1890364 RepID=A0A2P6N890_9EUKA|nr:hypothetical protein PROFUN_12118 [Planoprotostelium fungivorum]